MGLVFKSIWLAVGGCVLMCAATTATSSANTAKKKTAKRPVHAATKASAKPPSKSAPKTAAAKSGTAGAKAGSAAAKSKIRTKRVVRSTQQAPTPERYREIQAALIDKGYLQGEPTGEWGQDSVDALKRFQADENLSVDGKIGALSLIALGLGPKRLSAQAPLPQPAAQQPVQQATPPPPPVQPPAAQQPPADPPPNVAK